MEVKTINREGYTHIVIKNSCGMEVELSPVGASIYDIKVPNKNGEVVSVLLKPSYMEDFKRTYYGKTIGRFAGRIDKGVCTIDGVEYKLDINWCEANSLHGGFNGLSSQVCDFTYNVCDDLCEVVFTYVEAEGMLPGTVNYEIIYQVKNDSKEITTIHNAKTNKTMGDGHLSPDFGMESNIQTYALHLHS